MGKFDFCKKIILTWQLCKKSEITCNGNQILPGKILPKLKKGCVSKTQYQGLSEYKKIFIKIITCSSMNGHQTWL